MASLSVGKWSHRGFPLHSCDCHPPLGVLRPQELGLLLLVLSCPFMECNLTKQIAHESEGLLQVQLQTFYKYSRNSTLQPLVRKHLQ